MALTVQMIESKEFSRAAMGYNRKEVDEFLDEICDEMDRLHEEIASLQMRLSKAGQTQVFKATPGAVPAPSAAAPAFVPAPISVVTEEEPEEAEEEAPAARPAPVRKDTRPVRPVREKAEPEAPAQPEPKAEPAQTIALDAANILTKAQLVYDQTVAEAKKLYDEKVQTAQEETGSAEYRAVAEEAVEKSLVLLKNEGNVLPFRSGTTVWITGPAANNAQAQCGGWSIDWTGWKNIPGVTTLLDGFNRKADEYGIRVITDEAEADQADVVLLVVGESAYAEWTGDTKDLGLCSSKGTPGNRDAILAAAALGKPVVACIVAGRHVLIGDYIDGWDAAVMCYLPGTEGQGVANVLCGKKPFTGKLPSPWYSSEDQIGTGECWLPLGYGRTTD